MTFKEMEQVVSEATNNINLDEILDRSHEEAVARAGNEEPRLGRSADFPYKQELCKLLAIALSNAFNENIRESLNTWLNASDDNED